MDTLDRVLSAGDVVAVLGREVPLRVRNVSASGCLLESNSRLDQSTTGTIRIMVDGRIYQDTILVMWCRACEGSSALYHIGASFLYTSTPGADSIRRALAKGRQVC